jgi:hypothetical protein
MNNKFYISDTFRIGDDMCVYRKNKKILQLNKTTINNFLLSHTMVVLGRDVLFAMSFQECNFRTDVEIYCTGISCKVYLTQAETEDLLERMRKFVQSNP